MPRTAGPKRVNLPRFVHLTPWGRFPSTWICVVIITVICIQATTDHTNLKHIQYSLETRKLIKPLNHLHFETSVFAVDLQRSSLTKQVLKITLGYNTD